MITLAQFYAQVGYELRRGTSLDDLIPARVRQALRTIENLHTFRHQELRDTPSLISGQSTVAVPSNTIFKKIDFWRIPLTSPGGYHYMTQIDGRDASRQDTDIPNGYWFGGTATTSPFDTIYFDNIFDQTYTTQRAFSVYTTIPTDTTATPFIIQIFESALLAQTCLLFAPQMRDEKFMALQKAARDEALKTLVDTDIEARQANSQVSMEYGWEFKEEINRRTS